MEAFTFEKLEVWQKARRLVKEVYMLMDKFPSFEKYRLADQLSRSIVSVPSNIAEGSGKPSLKERIHYYGIAFGSLMESYTQVTLACDLEMITEDDLKNIRPKFEEVSKMLSGLRKSILNKINQEE